MARDGLLGESRPSEYPCECRRLQHLYYCRPSGLERAKSATKCFSESNANPKTQREVSVSQGHRHGQARYFGILRSIEFTIRILLAQFPQQLLRQGSLFFTARGKGKDDFGEGS